MTLVSDLDLEVFRTWLRRQHILCIDTETNVVENDHERFLVGISFYAPPGDPWYIPIGHQSFMGMPPGNVKLWDFRKDMPKDAVLIFHNAKFDLKILKKSGVDLFGYKIIDTMLWHHLVDQYRPHDLENLEVKLLGRKDKKVLTSSLKTFKKDGGYEIVPPLAMAKYAENDVVSTWLLKDYLEPLMEKAELLPIWWEWDEPFTKLLAKLEESGLKLDRQLAQQYTTQSKARMAEIRDALPFDPQRDVQVRARLFGERPNGLGLVPSKTTPGGKPSVDEDTLTGINHPEAGLLLEYRGLLKQVSTYFEGYLTRLDPAGYLHPTFKQHGTLTHRLSAENPNLQQVPRDGLVKGLFLPEEGCDLVEFDYRAVEFRLAAVYAELDGLLEVFRQNGDPHQAVADRLGIPRYIAKNTTFCILYGGGPNRIALTAGIPLAVAKEIYSHYHAEYGSLFNIAEKSERLALKRGFVRYWDKRRRVFKANYECRKAFNSIIQGGAFQIIKRSMMELDRQGYDMRNQVHDSIWLNLPKGWTPDPIEKIMVDWTEDEFGIPFHVDHKILHS